MTQIELKDIQGQFMELIELAASGEEIIISKDNRPLVKLSPALNHKRQRHFGSAKGLIIIADDFEEPIADFREYMT